MEVKTNKSYTVKEWFANKVANEVGANISMCNVFAVLKQTEKAVYAMLNLGTDKRKTMWVPKSVLVENEIGEDAATGVHHYETLFNDNYDECVEAFHAHWAMFK